MGCASSKAAGVAPETKIIPVSDDKLFKGARPKDEPSSHAQATAAGTTAVQSISLESCAATPREEFGAPAQQPTAKQQQKQLDPEFDYDLPPNPAATIKPADSGAFQTLGSTASASRSTAVQPSAAVGGLLCRQPDWLRHDSSDGGTRQPAGTVTLFSNSESGAVDSSSSSNRAASLPPIARGLAALQPAGKKEGSRNLDTVPALIAHALVQQSITAPSGVAGAAAAMAMELPAPRRLTANISSKMVPVQQPTMFNQSGSSDDGSAEAAAIAEATAADTKHQAYSATATLHLSSRSGTNLQGNDLFMHNSSGGSSSVTSLEPSWVGSSVDPSNPWSALQNHVGAAGPPSPDTTMSGGTGDAGTTAAAATAGRRKSGVGAQAAVLGAGVGAGSKHIACEASELVLEDSSDSNVEANSSSSSSHRKAGPKASVAERVAAVTAAVLAEQHKAPSGMARLQGEGSAENIYTGMQDPEQQQQQQHYGGGLTAERSTVRAGGWGKGSMAAAGTLMLGDDEQLVLSEAGGAHTSSTAAGALEQDDVFGSDSPWNSVAVQVSSRIARQGVAGGVLGEASGSSAVGYHAAAPAAAAAVMQQEEELLGVEEIDDVDAMIEAELAAKNALPSDLAAKLAAFEAVADDDQ